MKKGFNYSITISEKRMDQLMAIYNMIALVCFIIFYACIVAGNSGANIDVPILSVSGMIFGTRAGYLLMHQKDLIYKIGGALLFLLSILLPIPLFF